MCQPWCRAGLRRDRRHIPFRIVVEHQHRQAQGGLAFRVYSSICRSPLELPKAAAGRRPIMK